MKSTALFLILSCIIQTISAQDLYEKTFGDAGAEPIIFLHGGPGYNCANFEATTAQKLADNGYFVIVYDRRGEGRSPDKSAKFTFKQTFDDLDSIYNRYSLKKAVIIGHSFGGVVATLFAEHEPKKITAVVLVSAPVSLQETFKTIIQESRAIYAAKHDSANLKYMAMLENMDTASIAYSSLCFQHAVQNGFYAPKKSTDERKAIYAVFKQDTLAKYASQMTYPAPQGFWQNEKYTTINLTGALQDLVHKKIKVYGLYGKDDGLYSAAQVQSLASILGTGNLIYLDDCSHNVFIDQQTAFIQAIKSWIKK